MKCRSLWHSPAKAVRISTSRRFGFSMVTSSIVSGALAACNTAAFIGVPFPVAGRLAPAPCCTQASACRQQA